MISDKMKGLLISDLRNLARHHELRNNFLIEVLEGEHTHADLAYLVSRLCRELSDTLDQNDILRTSAEITAAEKAGREAAEKVERLYSDIPF